MAEPARLRIILGPSCRGYGTSSTQMEGRFVSAEKTRISGRSPEAVLAVHGPSGAKPPAVSRVAAPALRMLNQRYRFTNSWSVYASLRMAKSDKSGLPFPGSRHSGMVPIQVLPNLWLSVSFIVFRVSNQSTDFPNSWLIAKRTAAPGSFSNAGTTRRNRHPAGGT